MYRKIIAAMMALCAATAFAAVDVNKANQADLQAVKGLGAVSAGRIISERQKGAFKNWADLTQRVHGIKSGKASKLSSAGLTVNGQPYVAGAAPATARKGKHADDTAAAH